MSRGHDINLDWEREADEYFMFQIEYEQEMRAEYEQWLESQRKPAKITILTPIENEVPNNTLPF